MGMPEGSRLPSLSTLSLFIILVNSARNPNFHPKLLLALVFSYIAKIFPDSYLADFNFITRKETLLPLGAWFMLNKAQIV